MFSRAFVVFLICFGISESVFASDFEDDFRNFLRGKDSSYDIKSEASRYNYVFVAGFLNEKIPFYFKDSVTVLEELDVRKDSVLIIKPPSKHTPHENLSFIKKSLARLDQSKPLVIIAHSKGAVEMLLYALHNPAFVKERVQAIFLVQGAYRGSPIVDYFTGKGYVCDQRISKTNCVFLASVRRLGQFIVNDGFRSMSPVSSKLVWSRLYPNFAEIKDQIDNKIFYIRSYQDYKRQTGLLRIFGAYLSAYFGENDGLVALNEQSLAWIGKTIAVIPDAGHGDFVTDAPISAKSVSYRVAFTKALLTWLARVP